MSAAASNPWRHITLKPDPTYERLKDSPPASLAPSSVATYLKRIRHVRVQFDGAPIITILCKGQEAIKQLEDNAQTYGNAANTLVADLTAVLAVAKHVMSDRATELASDYLQTWHCAHKRLQSSAQAAFQSNKATPRQREGFVPYQQLCQARDALTTSNPMRLWLAMSTMAPCQRAGDYANCRVFLDPPTPADNEAHGDNYVVLSKGALHMLLFKTKRCYPEGIVIQMPTRLCLEIVASLNANPRRYMFVKGRQNQPYTNRKSFTNWLEKNLKTVFRNPSITPQLVRRAYVTAAHASLRDALSSADPATRALAQQQQQNLAHACAHSITTHQRYRFDLDDGGEPELLMVEATTPLPVTAANAPITVFEF
jgi:hypothetical protein